MPQVDVSPRAAARTDALFGPDWRTAQSSADTGPHNGRADGLISIFVCVLLPLRQRIARTCTCMRTFTTTVEPASSWLRRCILMVIVSIAAAATAAVAGCRSSYYYLMTVLPSSSWLRRYTILLLVGGLIEVVSVGAGITIIVIIVIIVSTNGERQRTTSDDCPYADCSAVVVMAAALPAHGRPQVLCEPEAAVDDRAGDTNTEADGQRRSCQAQAPGMRAQPYTHTVAFKCTCTLVHARICTRILVHAPAIAHTRE